MNFISNNSPLDIIPNEILCKLEYSPLSFKTIKTIEMRKQMIEEGYVNAEEFIQKLSSFDNKN